jgi:hypothetical protein
MKTVTDYPLVVFVLALSSQALSAWLGSSFLRARRPLDDGVRDDFGVIQGATLTLLALIIGLRIGISNHPSGPSG